MLLAIDVGNTNVALGVVKGERLCFTARMATDRQKTEDEYALSFSSILSLRGVSPAQITGAIVSSVVPELKEILRRAIELLIGRSPLVVGAGVRTGLNIKIDNPAQLGSDMVVGAVAACSRYPKPLVLVDMGTATTLSVIDAKGTYLGGMIIPGIRLSLQALSSHASQLPHIDLEPPARVIGTNTVDCMRSGAIYGNAAMLDGVISLIEKELGTPLATVVATGGLLSKLIPYCRHSIVVDENLMLEGLRIIYEKNRPR